VCTDVILLVHTKTFLTSRLLVVLFFAVVLLLVMNVTAEMI